MCGNQTHDIANSEAEIPAAAASSCCGGGAPADVAECPVMRGSLVNKAAAEAAGLYRDHNGQRYWFCCAGCGPAWDADPEKYAAA